MPRLGAGHDRGHAEYRAGHCPRQRKHIIPEGLSAWPSAHDTRGVHGPTPLCRDSCRRRVGGQRGSALHRRSRPQSHGTPQCSRLNPGNSSDSSACLAPSVGAASPRQAAHSSRHTGLPGYDAPLFEGVDRIRCQVSAPAMSPSSSSWSARAAPDNDHIPALSDFVPESHSPFCRKPKLCPSGGTTTNERRKRPLERASRPCRRRRGDRVLMIEDILSSAGALVIGPTGTTVEALTLIEQETIDCANRMRLLDGMSVPVAEALAHVDQVRGRDGYDAIPPEYNGEPVLVSSSCLMSRSTRLRTF